MGYYSTSASSCVDCEYDIIGMWCSSDDKKDKRWEINRIIIESTPETNLIGTYCDIIGSQDPKYNCNWGNLGQISAAGYCKPVSIFDPNPGPIPDPLDLEYLSAPINEYENTYIVQLEYIEDTSDSNNGTKSPLDVKTEIYINNTLAKTINTTLNTKGEKKDIARIKRQFGKFEVTILP
jgi:hypothetical protein